MNASLLTAREMFDLLPEDVDSTGWLPIPGEGDLTPELVIVQPAPTAWDANARKPLVGKFGLPIRRALVKAGIRYYVTSAFPFFTGKAKVNAKTSRLAAPVVAEELRHLGADKVLLLGAGAAKFTPGFDYPYRVFNEVLGRTVELGGVTYRVAHAPAAIATNPTIYSEFIRAVRELLHPESIETPDAPERESYRTITNRFQADAMFRRMPTVVAADTESTGLDPYTARILTVQFSWEPGVGYALPWELYSPEQWQAKLFGKKLIWQNGTYDTKLLAANGVAVQIHEDTMLMHSLVQEVGAHSLEHLSIKYLGIDKWGDLVDYEDMENTPLETLGEYGARDTDLTLRLANHFRPQVQDRYIHTLLTRAQNAITRSEIRGVRVDRDKALGFQREVEGHLHDRQEYMADVHGLANANSPKQVAELLYGKLGLPVQKLKGKVTTNTDAISPFANECGAVHDILEYRHLTKVNGTYLKNILETSERDGRYHGEFRLAGTETGRLTESLILVIPRPDELEDPDLGEQYRVRLRELFIPDEGMVMVGADGRGLEVGMSAYLTNDTQLIEDYNANLDTHSAVAIQAFALDIPLEPYATLKQRVSEHHALQRTYAKSGTFTWLYGGSEAALMRQLGISKELATQILDALRTRYVGVAAWQELTQQRARKYGVVSTPWGRNRHFLFGAGLDQRIEEEQLREAINFPNQAMASDMNLAAFTELEGMGVQTLFPVHDAVYVQCPEDRAEQTAKTVKAAMENVLRGPVQFEADTHIGANWAEL